MHATLTAFALTAALAGLVAAAPSAPVARADLVFADDFETGSLSQWDIQACPDGASISADVARTGKNSVKFTVNDGDTHAKCSAVPTENPRAQLVSPGLFHDGDEFYIALSMLFPEGFPKPTSWFQLAELYGSPFNGSPTMGLDICNGNQICFVRDQSNNNDHIWEGAPIVTNQWRDIILHVKFSTDANVGFVEIWDNGQPQPLSNGQNRINYKTLNPDVNWDGTPNSLFINQYRSSDESLGTVTLYHDSVKIGTTLQSVQNPAAGNGTTLQAPSTMNSTTTAQSGQNSSGGKGSNMQSGSKHHHHGSKHHHGNKNHHGKSHHDGGSS